MLLSTRILVEPATLIVAEVTPCEPGPTPLSRGTLCLLLAVWMALLVTL